MVMLVATDRGVPLVRARVVIEVTTLAVGGLLGGDLGVGTAVFAVAAGPLIAGWLRVLRWRGTVAPEETRPSVGSPRHDVPEPRNSSPATGRLRRTANAANTTAPVTSTHRGGRSGRTARPTSGAKNTTAA